MRRFASSMLVVCTLACARSEPELRGPSDSASTPESSEPSEVAVATTRVSGRVLDHAGQPLAAAHVEIRRAGFIDAVADFELGPDGVFDVELEIPGVYMIGVAGVDRAYTRRQLAASEDPIDLEFRLGTYARTEPGDTLAILARWVDADGAPGPGFATTAIRSEPSAAHHLQLEIPSGARALHYQLNGLHEGHTVNGPVAQRFVFDGGGDYWSELDVADSMVELELDLDLDAQPPAGQATEFELNGALSYPMREAEAALRPFRDRIVAEGDDAVPRIAADARASIEALEPKTLGDAAAIEWLVMFGPFVRSKILDPPALDWVFERVPPDDIGWAFYASPVSFGLAWLDTPAIRGHIRDVLAQQHDPGLLALTLYAELLLPDDSDDEAAEAAADADRYQRLATEFPGTYARWMAAANFDPDRPFQVGRTMPEWSFPTLDGEPLSSSDLRGQPYLLDLWATWCSPCVGELPGLHEAYAAINGDQQPPRVEFVSISNDRSPADVQAFRETWPMPWRQLWIPDDEYQALMRRWRVSGIPSLVLVDADGVVVAITDVLRGPALHETLAALVADSPDASTSARPRTASPADR